jgi:hypothetical protein
MRENKKERRAWDEDPLTNIQWGCIFSINNEGLNNPYNKFQLITKRE